MMFTLHIAMNFFKIWNLQVGPREHKEEWQTSTKLSARDPTAK